MTTLNYTNYPGFGERDHNKSVYSQAVRVGDIIEISGQGGWAGDEDKIPTDLAAEIANAFTNVDITLKNAVSTAGWKDVYKIRSYHTLPLDMTVVQIMIDQAKKWFPEGHKPLWTVIGVASLALEGMNVEIEVKAYVPKE